MNYTREQIEEMANEHANQWMDGRDHFYGFKAGFEKALKLFNAMKSSTTDYVGLVKELNTELYERFDEVEKGFEYSTTGFVDAISFNGVLLWNSEMEFREWIEEKNDYEPFEPFIRRIFNEYIDEMTTLKL